MKRRLTQSDVAKAAGVHRSTVSLCFKNDSGIPYETKQKVLRCAQEIGYYPDPMLSSLSVYRSRMQPKSFQGTIAWLANDCEGESAPGGWRIVKSTARYYEGALKRAKSHGFQIDVFDLAKSNPLKLAALFRARNIRGILVPPQLLTTKEIKFPWEDFSSVTFGYSLVKPKLHTVTATHFRSMVMMMQELKRRGYRRIGFFFDASHDNRTDHNPLAGFLVESFLHNDEPMIPPLLCSYQETNEFMEWYQKYRPDALITGHTHILDVLRALNIAVPDTLGVAMSCVWDNQDILSGVYEDSVLIGEVAVDYLVGLIHRGERGVPSNPTRLHVEGVWYEGKTVRQITESPALNATPYPAVG